MDNLNENLDKAQELKIDLEGVIKDVEKEFNKKEVKEKSFWLTKHFQFVILFRR